MYLLCFVFIYFRKSIYPRKNINAKTIFSGKIFGYNVQTGKMVTPGVLKPCDKSRNIRNLRIYSVTKVPNKSCSKISQHRDYLPSAIEQKYLIFGTLCGEIENQTFERIRQYQPWFLFYCRP